ncbi:MAG TPA: protein-glutamate O-methyltransferase CheR [Rhodocyclaceae bacterium]|nr:protein-glutamate O-methyltransferase CheR [Rhodocyclaceae bacterium]
MALTLDAAVLAPPEEIAISSGEFAKFRRLIHEIAGISLSDAKKVLLVGRLSRRVKHYGYRSFSEYYRHVTDGHDPGERQLMVDLLTTNETYFFREEKHFDFLRWRVLPAHPRGRPFDAWSAASSTGEESYTTAMVLADHFGLDAQWSVFGSDISLSVLHTAESGHYPMDKMRGLPPEYQRKYCLRGVRSQEGTFMIDRRLRLHTRFAQINLNAELPDIGSFDVIFLRNVMIYFDAATKAKVVARLAGKLRRGGHLVIGHAETLHGVNNELLPVQPTIYRKP